MVYYKKKGLRLPWTGKQPQGETLVYREFTEWNNRYFCTSLEEPMQTSGSGYGAVIHTPVFRPITATEVYGQGIPFTTTSVSFSRVSTWDPFAASNEPTTDGPSSEEIH